MDATSIGIAAVSAGGTGLTMTWLVKLLINRFITENDKKHEENKNSNKILFKKLDALKDSHLDLQLKIERVLILKNQMLKDHDKLTTIETWNKKYKDDLIAQFKKIKDIEDQFEDVSNFISTMRREVEKNDRSS